jgi:hypothetical protein
MWKVVLMSRNQEYLQESNEFLNRSSFMLILQRATKNEWIQEIYLFLHFFRLYSPMRFYMSSLHFHSFHYKQSEY